MTTLPAATERYTATMILGQEHWEISFPIGDFGTEKAAEDAVDAAEAVFGSAQGHPCITVSGIAFGPLVLKDSDVLIREMTAEAVSRLGPPLDMTIHENRATAVAALLSGDAAYIVEDADFVRSALTLADFIARYGVGYRPDCIGYAVADSGER